LRQFNLVHFLRSILTSSICLSQICNTTQATHTGTLMSHNVKPRQRKENNAMLGTVMPTPADAELNPDDKG